MTTGIHSATFTNLQLNAGAFIRSLDHSKLTTVDALKADIAERLESGEGLLGMTQGGGTFVAQPTIRNIEGDGLRAPFVGGVVNDGWTVKLTGTMKEITPENFKMALLSADVETEDKKTTITARTAIKEDDYIDSLCWVGDTPMGFIVIALENVLNTVGATMTFTDKGEGTIPFEMHAHHSDPVDQDKAPFEIIFLTSATE